MSNKTAAWVIDNQARGKSDVGRADLLWALQTLDANQHESIAALLGFERHDNTDSMSKRLPVPNLPNRDDQKKPNDSTKLPDDRQVQPQVKSQATTASYYRVVSYHLEQTQTNSEFDELSLPDWFTQAKSTLLEESVTRIPKIHRVKPLHIELTAWPRMLPFLQRVLGDRIEGRRPDTVKLVKHVASGKIVWRIPYQQRQHWAPKVRVLIDINDDNFPYRRDFLHLRNRLLQARGNEGLQVQYCYDEPGGYIVRYQQQREIIEPWSKPAQCTPILILSDLGRHAQSRQTLYAWLAFGQMLRAQGFRATVLMPVAERQIDPRLLQFFDCVVWDRSSRLRLIKGNYQAEQDKRNHAASIDQLLASLFAGVRVDSGLLRAMRYCLPGGYDIGHETAVWRHSAVIREGDEWGWLAASKPSYLEQARSLLRILTPQQQEQWVELIGRHHALYPDELYFESMYNLKLLGLPLPMEVEVATEKYLQDMVKTYQAHPDNSLLHAWVKRHLARHEAKTIRQQHHYWTALMAFAKKRDEQQTGVSTSEWPNDLSDTEKATAWNFLNTTQDSRVYHLRQTGEKLTLVPEKSEARLSENFQSNMEDAWNTDAISGTNLLTLRLSDTHLFHTHTDQQGRQAVVSLNLAQSSEHAFQLAATGQHTFQIGSARVTVDVTAAQQQKADWMIFMGSGSEGLYAESRDAQNRVYRWYWHAPSLMNHQTLCPGFWYSEPQLSQAKIKPDWAGGAGRDEYGLYANAIIAGITQRFRWIEPTSFMMGSPESEDGRHTDEKQHRVILTRGYWLADTACTQALWQAVMYWSVSDFKGKQLPVENVSWEDVQDFLKQCNNSHPQLQLRLPTGAEWENACRAGTTGAFNFDGNLLLEKVNYSGFGQNIIMEYAKGAKQQTAAVKSYPPNAWGLYEMHGNVWEWCQDWYGDYPSGVVIDPQGPESGDGRELRGGSWDFDGKESRSASRKDEEQSFFDNDIGFRLARGHDIKPSRVLGADQQPADRSATEREKAQMENDLRSDDKAKNFMDRIKGLFKGGDEV